MSDISHQQSPSQNTANPVVKTFSKTHIRMVLVVPFMLQIILAVGLTGYLSYRNGQIAISDLATQLHTEITARIEQYINNYLKIPSLVVDLNANAIRNQQLDLEKPRSWLPHLLKQSKVFDSLSYIYAGNKKGDYIALQRKDEGGLAYNVRDAASKNLLDDYSIEFDGTEKNLNNPVVYDPRLRPWYQTAVKAGKPVWTDIYQFIGSKGTEQLGMSFVAPYLDNKNELQGVLGADFSLTRISDFLRSVKVGKTGKIFIVDKAGLLVGGSFPYPSFDKNKQRLKALDVQEPLIAATAQFMNSNFGQFNNINRSEELHFAFEGEQQLVHVAPFNNPFGLPWLTVVVVPEADFMEQININTRTTLMLSFMAVLMAIAIGFFTSKWIVQPILRLNKAAKKLSGGDWDQSQSLPVGRSDELGELARSFDSMSKQLKQSFETLEELNTAYSRFVPHQFLQFLNKKSIVDVRLGDQVQKEMSILFSDIRSFTTLSESMTPEDNFRFINAYLSRMEPEIIRNDGFIDKYIGDAIMALFGGSADQAVTAGITMLDRLVEYNAHREQDGYIPIHIGIGINTGKLMLGTVGGHNRMDGSVISDAVNLASRIEGLTKNYGVALLISHQTYSRLVNPAAYSIRMVDKVKVKGKSELVTVYEVFDADAEENRQGKLDTLEKFSEALRYYYDLHDIETSARLFAECLAQNPHDTVAKIYLDRCHNPEPSVVGA